MTQEELLAAAQQYSESASGWFRRGATALKEKEQEIFAQAKLEAPGLKEAVTDLTQVVRALRQMTIVRKHEVLAVKMEIPGSALFPPANH